MYVAHVNNRNTIDTQTKASVEHPIYLYPPRARKTAWLAHLV